MRYILNSPQIRMNAEWEVRGCPDGYVVTVAAPTRSTRQNALLHSLIGDIVKSGFKWAGKVRNADEVKMLMISAHAVATKEGAEIVPGLEGEFVAIRESSAKMTVSRASSLIEYILAYCAMNEIDISDTRDAGFAEMMERIGG